MSEVAIVGIGMHPFGRTPGVSGLDQAAVAVRRALDDAGVGWPEMQFAFGGSLSSGAADSLVGRLGLTGLPFVNVLNGCATGASALASGVSAIESGAFEVGVVVGFDKHEAGAFRIRASDSGLGDWYGASGLALTTQFFGMKINRYMHDHGISDQTLAKVAAKAFANAEHNDMAWRRRPLGVAEILASSMVSYPLTKYMFCSPSEGAVALVLARRAAATTSRQPVRIDAVSFRTRRYGSFEVLAPSIAIDSAVGPTVDASIAAFESAGIGPEDCDVVQLQDTEAGAEVMHLAECGFCEHGEQEKLLADDATAIGGRLPVNTDGGCIANGEPVGASGLRQIYENVLQLRGDAGVRQVPGNPRTAFTHVYGAPGLSAVTVLSR